MNIRLYNARILTMEENRDVFKGEIGIVNGRIAYVSENSVQSEQVQDEQTTWDLEVDCKGNLLMPGFKNAHTHSGMTFLRSYADDLPLQEWLNEQVFPLEAKLTSEDIYELTKLAVLEYLTSGITSIFDMYLDPDMVAKACQDTGMRCTLVSGLNNFSSSIEQVEAEYLKWNEKDSLINYQLGFHAEYTCSKDLLLQVAKLAHKYEAPVYAHLAETAREVEQCINNHGKTPAVFLDSLGLFDYGGGGYHCVHMTEEDMEIFQKNHMFVITNPGSNTKLASGIAPLSTYLEKGIPVAIGTDGPASNNCLDMFREMFLVTGLSKLRNEDASSMDAMEVLKMATVNGAHALGIHDADILRKGKLADIIMLDMNQPNMQPIHNIPKNIVYSGSKLNVCMTMIQGNILYQNGMYHVGESIETIYEKCQNIVKRIIG